MTNKRERDKEESDKWKQRLPRGGADSGRGPRALTDRGMISDRSRNHLNASFGDFFCANIFVQLSVITWLTEYMMHELPVLICFI